jgi:hypothetical protein
LLMARGNIMKISLFSTSILLCAGFAAIFLCCAKKDANVQSRSLKTDTTPSCQSQPIKTDTVSSDTAQSMIPEDTSAAEVMEARYFASFKEDTNPTYITSRIIQGFIQNLRDLLSDALASCSEKPIQADSIAMAFYDSLDRRGDLFFDLYYTPPKNQVKGISNREIDSVLHENGLVVAESDGGWMFKGSTEFVLDRFQKYLSEPAKAFFQARGKDQLQSCIYDDAILLLPWETYAQRMQMWDSFCASCPNTCAEKRGKEYLIRYLLMHLLCHYMSYEGFSLAKVKNEYVHDYGVSWTGKVMADYYKNKNSELIDSLRKEKSIPYMFDILVRQKEIEPSFPSAIIEITDTDFAHHAGEVDFKLRNKNWLALVAKTNNQWELLPAKQEFSKCLDIFDSPEKRETTGVCISVPISGARYLLLDSSMSSGPVAAAFFGEKPRLPERGSSRAFFFLGKAYCLASKISDASNDLIYLERNGNRQYLFNPYRRGDTRASLHWIGDLDRDGKLDVILDASIHNNLWILRLFLSGKAKPGEMLGWAAEIISSGD